MAAQEFPYEIKNVTEEEDKIIKKYYKDYVRPFIRVGPKGYISNAGYGDHASEIYNLEVRPDDVWVTTFSRSGTTWLQELVWLVGNNLDFDTARAVSLTKRFAYIEYPTQQSEIRAESTDPNAPRATYEDFRSLANMTSPRYVKSHLPLSLLPPKLLETAKVFYIARDPRDVCVSHHFAHKLFNYFDKNVEFKEFWELFKKDLILHTPIFPHVEEAWQKRDHPNMMFLFYEDMQNDLRSVIDRVCLFLNKDYSNEQKQQLIEFLHFDNMKKKSTLKTDKEDGNEITFFRKGKSGNWVKYFDEEMTKEAEEYMEKNLKLTTMRFPDKTAETTCFEILLYISTQQSQVRESYARMRKVYLQSYQRKTCPKDQRNTYQLTNPMAAIGDGMNSMESLLHRRERRNKVIKDTFNKLLYGNSSINPLKTDEDMNYAFDEIFKSVYRRQQLKLPEIVKFF